MIAGAIVHAGAVLVEVLSKAVPFAENEIKEFILSYRTFEVTSQYIVSLQTFIRFCTASNVCSNTYFLSKQQTLNRITIFE